MRKECTPCADLGGDCDECSQWRYCEHAGLLRGASSFRLAQRMSAFPACPEDAPDDPHGERPRDHAEEGRGNGELTAKDRLGGNRAIPPRQIDKSYDQSRQQRIVRAPSEIDGEEDRTKKDR